nr:hypothetical protein Iba_chr13aCG7890 [Ipomoea batatas]
MRVVMEETIRLNGAYGHWENKLRGKVAFVKVEAITIHRPMKDTSEPTTFLPTTWANVRRRGLRTDWGYMVREAMTVGGRKSPSKSIHGEIGRSVRHKSLSFIIRGNSAEGSSWDLSYRVGIELRRRLVFKSSRMRPNGVRYDCIITSLGTVGCQRFTLVTMPLPLKMETPCKGGNGLHDVAPAPDLHHVASLC